MSSTSETLSIPLVESHSKLWINNWRRRAAAAVEFFNSSSKFNCRVDNDVGICTVAIVFEAITLIWNVRNQSWKMWNPKTRKWNEWNVFEINRWSAHLQLVGIRSLKRQNQNENARRFQNAKQLNANQFEIYRLISMAFLLPNIEVQTKNVKRKTFFCDVIVALEFTESWFISCLIFDRNWASQWFFNTL